MTIEQISRLLIVSFLLVNVITFSRSFAQDIVINEVMASNRDILADEDLDTPDWIEIFNAGDVPVSLFDWGISDDTIDRFKWIFPDITIDPDHYLIIFASGKDRREGEYLHSNFKLKGGHDPIALFNPDSVMVDYYEPTCLPTNISLGYQPDGSGIRQYFMTPSPGSSNNDNQVTTINIVKDTLISSHDGGFYNEAFTLELSKMSDDTKIYYTTDGSIPDEESLEYAGPMDITSRTGEENTISDINTGPFWVPPEEDVFKVNVIRAIVISDGCPSSNLITNTYLVDENIYNRYHFPVISISTDRSSLFGKNKGIYVPGKLQTYDDSYSTGNYFESGSDWERQVHLEFFNTEGSLEFEQDAGVRIHGRGSRKLAQKTLKVYNRDKYGKEVLDYQLFPEKELSAYKTYLIRATLGDRSGTYFKDELCHKLIKDLNMDIQAHQPSIVFINGEYWGIHNLRERQDKYYIGNNNQIDPENLDVIALSYNREEVVEGDSIDYHNMIDFIADNDINDPEVYERVKSWMDIDNYIDYYISQLYFANFDWPESNIKYWRSRDENGRWRWLFYDCDWCFIRNSWNHLSEYTIEDDRYYQFRESATFLFRSLLKNQEFRQEFNTRFMYHLNTTFEPSRVIDMIEEYKQWYAPMVVDHIKRWHSPESFKHWLDNVESLKYFAFKRPAAMMTQLVESLGIPYSVYPNPAVEEFTIASDLPEDTPHRVEIFDLFGKLHFARNWSTTSDLTSNPISIHSFSSGIYIIKFQYGNLVFVSKLVIANQ